MSDDIELPDGPLRFVSAAVADDLAARVEELEARIARAVEMLTHWTIPRAVARHTLCAGGETPTGLTEAGAEVIAAADNTYGPNWREWHRPAGAGPGAQRLSRALVGLEQHLPPRRILRGENTPETS